MPPDDFDSPDRYHRQMLLPGFGEAGQRRLGEAHALIVGCGALGSAIADSLARAGVGTLTIVDRDLVETTNLQRQVLFDEDDVEGAVPKAEAARARLARVNRQVTVHARVEDFSARNATALATGADIILDGLDNFETRYLLNDLAVKHGIPYVYGGAVGTTGVSMAVLPHPSARKASARQSAVTWNETEATPCLRCVFPEAPPPGSTPTCDTAGVLGPVVSIIAGFQSSQALKILTGNVASVDRSLLSIELWTNEFRRFDVSGARQSGGCPCCDGGVFDYLEGSAASNTTALCGRNAVQITPSARSAPAGLVDLAATAARLSAHGEFSHNGYLLRGVFSGERGSEGSAIELTLFPDGRAIIKGTPEPEAARSIYAKYVGA